MKKAGWFWEEYWDWHKDALDKRNIWDISSWTWNATKNIVWWIWGSDKIWTEWYEKVETLAWPVWWWIKWVRKLIWWLLWCEKHELKLHEFELRELLKWHDELFDLFHDLKRFDLQQIDGESELLINYFEKKNNKS